MKISIYQLDAFTQFLFQGNPAAVCPLESWLPDDMLQRIAAENNLSETAFFVPETGGFRIRWFSPVCEIQLCGHATLAAAYVLFEIEKYPEPVIHFFSLGGPLNVVRSEYGFSMDFPASQVSSCECPQALAEGLGMTPTLVLAAEDYIAVLESESQVKSLQVDFSALSKLDLRGVAVTAKGDDSDYVNRFFAPKVGINEDSVTGSAHCQLAPYWANQLGKSVLKARQLSARGGDLICQPEADRVHLSGRVVKYMQGEIEV